MKLTTLKLGVLAFGLFAYSQTASAQEEQKKPDSDKLFKWLDTNKDGSITLEEFKNKKRKNEVPAEILEARFTRMDADANGLVTKEEFQNNMAKGKAKAESMKKPKAQEEENEGDN